MVHICEMLRDTDVVIGEGYSWFDHGLAEFVAPELVLNMFPRLVHVYVPAKGLVPKLARTWSEVKHPFS